MSAANIIRSEFNKIISKAITTYSRKLECEEKEIQVLMSIRNEQVCFQICKKYNPVEEVTFKDLMGVKIDFKGYSVFVPPFILKSLYKIGKEKEIAAEKTIIMIIRTNADNILYLYNDTKPVCALTFEEIFSEEDVMKDMQEKMK